MFLHHLLGRDWIIIKGYSDLDIGWDGRYKYYIQNSDAYAYRVAVLNWKEEIFEAKGYINLTH